MKNPVFIFLLIIMYSCNGYHYVPSPHYVPLNTDKGEFSICTGPHYATVGYSFANHVSCFASGHLRVRGGSATTFQKENSGTETIRDDFSGVNGGLSYFNKYKFLRFEVLGGGGVGTLHFENTIDLSPDYDFKMNASRSNLFLQPNIGVKLFNYFEAGVSAKFLRCRYYGITTDLIPGTGRGRSYNNYFMDRKSLNVHFFELGLILRGGFKDVKAQLQVIPVVQSSNNSIRYRDYGLFFGVNMNMNVLTQIKH